MQQGKSSPFGTGTAGSGNGGGSMAGNNFVTNPRGTPSNVKIPDLLNTSRVQPKAEQTQTTTAGVLPLVAPPANRPGGVGTPGNGSKPFKLGG